MDDLIRFYILTAYYHSSERSYSFGPFTRKSARLFIENDPTPEKHEEWHWQLVNSPRAYGTGREYGLEW